MYLKSITLRGFKSFAKKSQLIFNRGISVIVGPNGSGKSNIVDAISWVLGSQSPKSLRGNSMDDVIFRSKQEELAIAEVSLLFDNTDKFLPLAFNEIKITRRVFQKGGSEYYINSSPSRLQDIQDITSERGIGKGLYTIINQGQIDDIALLKPVERKILIDELIGIAKHKTRREKTRSRMVKVKNDVERIDDLMHEVKRTMDPLEIEAKKARKYSGAVNRLKDIEMALFVHDINELNSLWEEKNKRYDFLKEKIGELDTLIAKTEKDKKEFEDDFGNRQKSFREMKEKIENYRSFENKLESILGLAESKNNMFKTISNMLENECLSLQNSTELFSENMKAGSVSADNLQLYIEGLNAIKKKILDISESVQDYINSSDARSKFKQDVSSLMEEISGLIDLINKNMSYKDRNKKGVPDTGILDKITKTRTEIEDKIGFISKLQEYATENMQASGRFINVLGGFHKSLKKKKDIFLSGFDEAAVDIDSYNRQLNEYLRKTGDIGTSKQNKENELYRLEVQKDQIKENVKNLTESITDSYNLPVEYIFKNYNPPEDFNESRQAVKRLKKEIRQFGTVNPNAIVEYGKIKDRYDFLQEQKTDLVESLTGLEVLIDEINRRIEDIFNEKFDLINDNFNQYFKALFPLGNGEMVLRNNTKDDDSECGVDLKVDIGNEKLVPLSLLSGGEKALVSIAFLFSIFATNFSPFYVFDEIDASLDDVNLNRFILLVEKFASDRQIIIITHQKKTMEIADTIYGVSMQSSSVSKVVSEKVDRKNAKTN